MCPFQSVSLIYMKEESERDYYFRVNLDHFLSQLG